MAARKSTSTTKGPWGEWAIGMAVAIAALITALIVWAYTAWAGQDDRRPGPVWLTVPKVLSQLSDGRMVSVKVNLQLNDPAGAQVLEDHAPAVKAMIQQVGTTMTHSDLKGADGMRRYSKAIRLAVNGYLDDREMNERVKQVAFDELVLLP